MIRWIILASLLAPINCASGQISTPSADSQAPQLLILGAHADSGSHYEVGSFTKTPNDICQRPNMASPGVVRWLNSSIGKAGGVTKQVSRVEKGFSTDAVILSSIGIRFPSGENSVTCHITLIFEDGSFASGVVSATDPGAYAPLQILWMADLDIAAKRAQADRLDTAKNLILQPDLLTPAVQRCVGEQTALGAGEEFSGQLWAACSDKLGLSPPKPGKILEHPGAASASEPSELTSKMLGQTAENSGANFVVTPLVCAGTSDDDQMQCALDWAAQKQYSAAKKIYGELAASGEGEPASEIAQMYEKGQGAPVDYILAAKWYEIAMMLDGHELQDSLALSDQNSPATVNSVKQTLHMQILQMSLEHNTNKFNEMASHLTAAQKVEADNQARQWQAAVLPTWK